MMEMMVKSYIQIVAVITWVCTFVTMQLTAHLKWYNSLYVTYTSSLKKSLFPRKIEI